jgi:acetyl esterase/lipase
MRKLNYIICLFLSIGSLPGIGQEFVMPLYQGKIPNSKPSKVKEELVHGEHTWLYGVTNPSISVYLPQAKYATGQAIIICPGGGYKLLSYDNHIEGTDVARYFNSLGIAAIVLKYRLPLTETSIEPYNAPLMDAQRAMRIVRKNASKWSVNPNEIGIMGFSAGGHLAASLGTHFDYGNPLSKDSIEHESSRPSFMILMYPVISFSRPSLESNSRKNLLAGAESEALLKFFSCELQVNEKTPPAFIAHAEDDKVVSIEHSLLMYEALHNANIAAELHILPEGGHGFGLINKNQHIASWKYNLELWLKSLQQ